jgi:hypothetical protein
MNAKQSRRSRKNEGYYKAQFARTERNKRRRVERLIRLFPSYRAIGYDDLT